MRNCWLLIIPPNLSFIVIHFSLNIQLLSKFSILRVLFLHFVFIYTAISINVVGSKYNAVRQDVKILWIEWISSSKSVMPRPSSEDIRWRAIWMKEILRYRVDEVAASLKMSLRFDPTTLIEIAVYFFTSAMRIPNFPLSRRF